jgi:hypothetical protein
MLTLRLTQHADSQPDYYRVEVALEGDGSRQTATVRFQFKLTQQEQENIRWYLEDYLQYLSDPAPQIAAKVERRTAEIGIELFKAIFQANDDARDLWATLRQNLNHTRVEILTDIAQATAIPWELLRDPKTDACLALRSPAFVRSYSQPAQRPRLPQTNGDTIRILLVICRPQGRDDVPFRSVASRLIKGLGTKTDGFQLDVLRPPTFEQLSRVLRQAKAQGKPYHVVHFDGHGVYQDSSQLALNKNPLFFADRRPGMHGYLAFENGLADENVEFVSGSDLGQLLVETDVPVLVLNACRSGHAEAQDAPTQIEGATSDQIGDAHSQARSFGSLAQEVMDAGVAGVVAMRYNVYVMTAAQFVADLYASLVQGQTLGEAVTSGRKQLKDQPQREVAYKPVALQDWLVPIVYEADAITLFPKPIHSQLLTIQLHENDALPTTGMLDAQLPRTPDAGFFGRDETLLAIDRAFDHHANILLHAFAGSGKTCTAAEFGRWYALTGGLLEAGKQGYVLFTSFQRYLPLSRVLDKLGQVFERDLARSGIHWLTLSDEQRRTVALQVLSQVPVLWIWDNVEPVAGFPDGETQRWSEAEHKELVDFLRDARDTKAKFLLTSRRDERGWLGDLPVRVQVPPMPMQERVQFARELAKKHGYRLTDVEDWRPLLKYTQGNPLTITVVVGQALRKGFRSKEQVERFVSDLQSGEAELDDDESEGRSKSLTASLSYGFTVTFTVQERRYLAFLHLFQNFLDVDLFCWMGNLNNPWCIQSLKALTREIAINLFARACEVGLLTKLCEGFYSIHPVLPWYFKKLFNQIYSEKLDEIRERVLLAFADTMSRFGNLYHSKYINGKRHAIHELEAEENNLLYSRIIALENELWQQTIGTMQGLSILYELTGNRTEWARLLNEILPYFVNSYNDLSLPGKEKFWGIITQYRVVFLLESRKLEDAERLQRILVKETRQSISHLLTKTFIKINQNETNAIRTLACVLHQLGEVQRELGLSECVENYEEAFQLAEKIGDQTLASTCAFNLGNSYKDIPGIYDLGEIKKWTMRSLELSNEQDWLNRAGCFIQLGQVASEYLKEAVTLHNEKEQVLDLFNAAIAFYQEALKMLPANAVNDLMIVHRNIGNAYLLVKKPEVALENYQNSIRYSEEGGDFYTAAETRFNIALALLPLQRFSDALSYANVALSIFESFGENAGEMRNKTRQLIFSIERGLLGKGIL